MDVVVGHLYCDDQSISMRMVYPLGVCLCEDNIFRLSLGTVCKVYIYFVHKHLGWMLCFFSISIACMATVSSFLWAPNDGKDFFYGE